MTNKFNNKYYKDFGEFLSKHFPYKVQKISINVGFSCPNHDGTKSIGGCTYCNNKSFSPGKGGKFLSVTEQLKEGIEFFSYKYTDMKYLAYFQSYTNTYDDVNVLIKKYEEALSYPNVVGLIVSTRPDCMPDELLDYFEKLNKRSFLIIEYGIESTINLTLDSINRCHSFEESVETINKTHEKEIMVGAHLILGLPGETREQILAHADIMSKLPLTTIKLHQLQLIKGTIMAKQYRETPEMFDLFELDEYIDFCIDFVERLNPEFVVERLISQSPKHLLLAPSWRLKSPEFISKLEKRFEERKAYQGRLYNKY